VVLTAGLKAVVNAGRIGNDSGSCSGSLGSFEASRIAVKLGEIAVLEKSLASLERQREPGLYLMVVMTILLH